MESNTIAITVAVVVTLVALLFSGLPVAFCLISVAALFILLFWSPQALAVVINSTYGVTYVDVYLAIPLFVLMAYVLEFSGIAEDLFEAIYKWSGRVRGSLAVATVATCAILAAMTGIGATGVVTMGTMALPQMMKRGYDKKLAAGAIMYGGCLGPVIPPSNIFVILGGIAGLSVGRLFMGGLFPGIVLAICGAVYIFIRSLRNRELAPALPPDELPTWRERFAALKGVVLPAILIVTVLGAIYTGAATPTEAAAVGAIGAIVCSAIHRTLTRKRVMQATRATFKLSAIIYWILIGGVCYSTFLNISGIGAYIQKMLLELPFGTHGILIMILLIVFLMGMLMETVAIIMITSPIFYPVIMGLGVDPIWFSVLFCIDLVIGYMTPPFGYNLFYLKGVVTERFTMSEIYSAAWPYVGVACVALVITYIFPQLSLWLPSMMIR